MPTQQEVQTWLDTGQAIAEPTGTQQLALDGLVGNEGFLTFLGLMQGERNGLVLQLTRLPLSADGGRWQAAVLQGRIQQIDNLAQTIVNLYPPAQG